MKKVTLFLALAVSVFNSGCESNLAVMTAPEKKAEIKYTASRDKAVRFFWKTFHAGAYSNIPEALVLLKAEYLNNPHDPQIPLYIAHLHLWRVAERFRLQENITPNLTDDLTVAIKYFIEAKKLNPEDARIDGWLAGARMAQATLHNDEKDKRSAYYQGLQSIKDYPAFNYFSIGYVFSNADHDSENFQAAIDWYFKSMELAYHTKIDRRDPSVAQYLHLEKQERDQRLKKAVWNSEIAPHNVEGFYLNFGDFLVKNGQIEKARVIYNNAKSIPGYSKWPYRHLLEDRLKNVNKNTESFSDTIDLRTMDKDEIIYKRMIFNSYNCMVCHQAE